VRPAFRGVSSDTQLQSPSHVALPQYVSYSSATTAFRKQSQYSDQRREPGRKRVQPSDLDADLKSRYLIPLRQRLIVDLTLAGRPACR